MLGLYIIFIEYPDMIGNYNESQLNLDQLTSILIGLQHQLDYDSATLIGFE